MQRSVEVFIQHMNNKIRAIHRIDSRNTLPANQDAIHKQI